jgi:hypothetical protein|tara:strand:+ start:3925 stop:4215 length:291 start_codon:yes stop_codon:yes gene_type:complete
MKKSPNDLSVLFERILEDLSGYLMTSRLEELTGQSELTRWDLTQESHRRIIGELLVGGMKSTPGWFLDLGGIHLEYPLGDDPDGEAPEESTQEEKS